MDTIQRDWLQEARDIVAGKTMLLATSEHLEYLLKVISQLTTTMESIGKISYTALQDLNL